MTLALSDLHPVAGSPAYPSALNLPAHPQPGETFLQALPAPFSGPCGWNAVRLFGASALVSLPGLSLNTAVENGSEKTRFFFPEDLRGQGLGLPPQNGASLKTEATGLP